MANGAVMALRSQWPACGHLLHMGSHIDMQVCTMHHRTQPTHAAPHGVLRGQLACSQSWHRVPLVTARSLAFTRSRIPLPDVSCACSRSQRGHYAAAVHGGQRAAAADDLYLNEFGREQYYFTYRNHHVNQLTWAAMFDGRHALASASARRIVDETPVSIFDTEIEYTEPLFALPWYVEVRFGQWEALLQRQMPTPASVLLVTTATAHWARALAHSALGQIAEAEAEQLAFDASAALVPPSRHIHNVNSLAVLAIARELLEGELSFRRGCYTHAFACLRAAVAADDALPYDEPWGWMTPARHALGALLLERAAAPSLAPTAAAQLLDEAEAVFRRDLEHHPNNLWALTGLHDALKRRRHREASGGHTVGEQLVGAEAELDVELADVAARLKRASVHADVRVCHSCFCAGRGGGGGADSQADRENRSCPGK